MIAILPSLRRGEWRGGCGSAPRQTGIACGHLLWDPRRSCTLGVAYISRMIRVTLCVVCGTALCSVHCSSRYELYCTAVAGSSCAPDVGRWRSMLSVCPLHRNPTCTCIPAPTSPRRPPPAPSRAASAARHSAAPGRWRLPAPRRPSGRSLPGSHTLPAGSPRDYRWRR